MDTVAGNISSTLRTSHSRELYAETLLYAAAAMASVFLLWLCCDLRNRDWSIPFWGPITGDSLFHAALVKSVVQNGWYLFNPFLGAPVGSELYDFYYAPTLHMAGVKLLSIGIRNFGRVFNFYFALSFPISTLTALFALRSFGVARLPALGMALLFAFLPFHILRGQLHLPYAAYFTVPLGCTVALWVWDTPWTGRKYAIAMLICGVLSLDLPYWPFFTAFAISVAGMCAAFANKSMHPIAAAITLVSLIGFTSFLNVSPNLLYRLHHGSNTAALVRHPQEAEIYGLKIVQLMLPVLDHRFAPFRKLRERYDAAAPLVNENSTDTLGMIAAIGFCALILFAFIDRNLCARWPVWRRLVKLNLACVLLGTVGGLGSLLSFTLFDKIRGYNRVSVLIGFFALFAVGIMLTEICSRVPVWAAWVLCVAVVVFGVWDQTPPNYNFYEVNKARMANDGAFIKAVEAKLPKASMIFELPYQRYPEGGFVNRMRDYEPLSPYLYSERLRWSYGSIKGRAEDARERQVASSAATEMLRALVLRGFRGIYIDRDGYPDNARALEESFTSILNEQPMVSGDSRLSFFDLTRVSTQFEKEVDSPNGKLLLGNILSNLVAWSPGCYDMERDDKGGQRWCSGHAELELDNPLSHPLAIAIHMRLFAGGQSQAAFVMDGPSGRQTLTISSAGTPLEMNLVAQPGRQTIRVICYGTPVKASNDSRVMVFLVRQFYLLAK